MRLRGNVATGGWRGCDAYIRRSLPPKRSCSPKLNQSVLSDSDCAERLSGNLVHSLEGPLMSDTTGRTFPLLPMFGHTKGKRSAVTCALKCDNACAGDVCNTSSNGYFRDIASTSMSRRAALGLGAAGALAVVLGSAVTGAEPAVADAGSGLSDAVKKGFGKSKLQFTAIKPVDAAVDAFTVPEGFDWKPIIRWGDPLFADSPAFNLNAQTA